MPSARPPLRVLLVTPLGRGGMGGIDRIMDEVVDGVARLGLADLELSVATTRGQRHIAWSPFLVARLLARVAWHRPDIVHVNLSRGGSVVRKLLITRWLRLLGVPYVVHLHGSMFHEFWDGVPAPLSAEIRRVFAHSACAIVLGRVWRDYVQARVPEIADRIRILPNASRAPAAAARAPTDCPTVLFLGHVGPRKGVPQLVEALSRLRHMAGWRAVIAGNGEVDALRARVAQQELGARVTVPGWVGPAEVETLLAGADILVLPSLGENLPMSVIEAMAHGLAVVTTPVGATPDIIEDDRTGLLVPPGDAPALTVALARVIGDPALRQRLGGAARAFHRDHLDMDRYVEHLVGIWRAAA